MNYEALMADPIPFKKKRHAIAYVNSKCNPTNGRAAIIRELQQLLQATNSSLRIHSFGECDPNMDAAALAAFRNKTPGPSAKIELFRQYKFCMVSRWA